MSSVFNFITSMILLCVLSNSMAQNMNNTPPEASMIRMEQLKLRAHQYIQERQQRIESMKKKQEALAEKKATQLERMNHMQRLLASERAILQFLQLQKREAEAPFRLGNRHYKATDVLETMRSRRKRMDEMEKECDAIDKEVHLITQQNQNISHHIESESRYVSKVQSVLGQQLIRYSKARESLAIFIQNRDPEIQNGLILASPTGLGETMRIIETRTSALEHIVRKKQLTTIELTHQ